MVSPMSTSPREGVLTELTLHTITYPRSMNRYSTSLLSFKIASDPPISLPNPAYLVRLTHQPSQPHHCPPSPQPLVFSTRTGTTAHIFLVGLHPSKYGNPDPANCKLGILLYLPLSYHTTTHPISPSFHAHRTLTLRYHRKRKTSCRRSIQSVTVRSVEETQPPRQFGPVPGKTYMSRDPSVAYHECF
ncbi:hypothetical protein Agabi119p4_8252 [Agaricus bisporus var. burnettii]|uniref:Uncharacterized protein n=1 Tax=Agaricus bisporus var. burnettii TaxID=192524 RepID=A0A8H7C5W4_AGABI|nr:hypothetical protein Agabi119p4_8252 [Agaricus bisporus var. burnettii]